MTETGIILRWLHLLGGLSLPGIFLIGWLAHPGLPHVWRTRLDRLAFFSALLLGASGALLLAYQSAVVTGQPGSALDPAVWLSVLHDTRFGAVWSWRMSLTLVLALLILARDRAEPALGRSVYFVLTAGMAVTIVGLMPGSGHAASVETDGPFALISATLHLLAAALWFGALAPLLWLLAGAAREQSGVERAFVVRAFKRFSALALGLMIILILSGITNTLIHVASIPALLGTIYGRLVLLKIVLLAPLLAMAWHLRRRLGRFEQPAVSRHGARWLLREWLMAALITGIAATLGLTLPARHDTPDWPLPFRLSYTALSAEPDFVWAGVIGPGVALLGIAALIFGWVARPRRRWLLALSGLLIPGGMVTGLTPLAMDAYPSTYQRTHVLYHALSIAHGAKLYTYHCSGCHGSSGYGDGAAAQGLPKPPANLTAPHTDDHTAGDIYWWLTHGIQGGGMPGFAAQIAPEGRWDLINYLRALSAAHQARRLAEVVEPNRPWLAAPDFDYTLGNDSGHTLKDLRGKRAVLLVLFTWPESQARLTQLARHQDELRAAGTELLAVPLNPQAMQSGNLPGLPMISEDQTEIAVAYGLFRRTLSTAARTDLPLPAHMELLVDRSGYLRARWIPGGDFAAWRDMKLLMNEVLLINQEAIAPWPGDHVH